jgi:hypothetical protein
MTISTVTALQNANKDAVFAQKTAGTTTAGSYNSMWYLGASTSWGAGSSPGSTIAGRIPTNTTIGGLQGNQSGVLAANASDTYYATAANVGTNGNNVMAAILCDRVFDVGELTPTSGAYGVTGTLVTRPSTGLGCFIGVEIQTAFNAFSHTLNITYTNQAGVMNQSTSITLPASALVNSFYMVPFQQGDSGCRQITAVSGSATPPTGAFNLVLYQPLIPLSMFAMSDLSAKQDWTKTLANPFLPTACLWAIYMQAGGSTQLWTSLTLAHG